MKLSDVPPVVRRTVFVLTVLCVALGLSCVALAVAWAAKDREATCWRHALEDDETVSAVDCGR